RTTPHGRHDPDRDAEQEREHDGRRRQLHGRWKAAQEVRQHRVAAHDRGAEVTADDLPHVEEVLLVNRPVEAELLPDGLRALRGGLLPEHGGGRVTWNQVDEAEDQDGNPEEDRDDSEASPDRVAPHHLPTLPGSRLPQNRPLLLKLYAVEKLR